jgi:uncharacterized protein YbbC (DUF1343 family)
MFRAVPLIFFFFTVVACHSQKERSPEAQAPSIDASAPQTLRMGAEQLDSWLPALRGKRLALLVNHTALVGKRHLVDTLLALGADVKKIFGPEHGFRGDAADGETVKNGVDVKSGLPVISLYGKNKKPTAAQLADVDAVIFDIQDVGTRFYTYISSMHYLMESCAENKKMVVILDRPNPHGSYIDGPMLEPAQKSFVGMHPIPVVHGLTVGELANMINGEGWLGTGMTCELRIVPMKNWKHSDRYLLPIYPSPNLPNNQAIALYPSLCFFEGTVISVGRGTEMPFQVIGNPELKQYSFTFTPRTIKGVANNPLHEHKVCYGIDLRGATVPPRLDLSYLINMYNAYPDKENFFYNPFDRHYIDKLAGTPALREQIKKGMTEEQIRETWQKNLAEYRAMRQKYLLYEE